MHSDTFTVTLQIPGNGRFQHNCHQSPVRRAPLEPERLHSGSGRQWPLAASSHLRDRETGSETVDCVYNCSVVWS